MQFQNNIDPTRAHRSASSSSVTSLPAPDSTSPLPRRLSQEALAPESLPLRDSCTSGGGRHPRIDTPEPSRTSARSRAALRHARSDMGGLLGALQNPMQTQAGKPAGDILRLMDSLLEIPEEAFRELAAERMAAKSTAELTDLLTGLAVVLSKVPAGDQHKQLIALDACARALLVSRMGAGAEGVVADLEAAARQLAPADEAGAERLQDALADLPDGSLLLAAHSQHEDLYWLARGEAVQRHNRSGHEALQAMASVRLLAGHPPGLNDWLPALTEAARRIEAHERYSAMFDKAITRDVTAARATLGATLRGLLERGDMRLHQATPAQRQALCTMLARLGVPVDPLRIEHHAQTASLRHCIDALQANRHERAMDSLKAAQAQLEDMADGQRQMPGQASRSAWCANLREQLLGDLLKQLRAEELRSLAAAMDGNDTRSLMAAMNHLSAMPQVGESLGKELAERHRDLSLLREAVGRALGEPAAKIKIPLADAARNVSARSTLRQAFALEVDVHAKGVQVLARNGPVRPDTQAVFDRSFAREAKAKGQPSTLVNGMAMATTFAESLGRVGLRVFNRHTGSTDVLNVRGKTVAGIVDILQERTGATPAQMVAMSRVFDADSRIDSAMLSHAGALRLVDGTVVLPVMSQGSRRESSVECRCDDKGNLRLRFHTEMTGIAGFIGIDGQLRQMRPAAPGHDRASFTHEVVISRNGDCSAPRLDRHADLRAAARGRDDGYPLVAKDLMTAANADVRRTLELTVSRTWRPAGTPTQTFMPSSPSSRQAALAQAIIDQAHAVLDAGPSIRN